MVVCGAFLACPHLDRLQVVHTGSGKVCENAERLLGVGRESYMSLARGPGPYHAGIGYWVFETGMGRRNGRIPRVEMVNLPCFLILLDFLVVMIQFYGSLDGSALWGEDRKCVENAYTNKLQELLQMCTGQG